MKKSCTNFFLDRRSETKSLDRRSETKSPMPFEKIKELEDHTLKLTTFVHDIDKKLKLKHLLRENEDLKTMVRVEIEKRENDCGEIRQKLDKEVEIIKEKMEIQERQRQTEKGTVSIRYFDHSAPMRNLTKVWKKRTGPS